jgi:hypothetical protein
LKFIKNLEACWLKVYGVPLHIIIPARKPADKALIFKNPENIYKEKEWFHEKTEDRRC